jgi:ABC-type nitrate/sulfonate/bicarbonate transport system substrate-binding protein
MRLLNIVSTRLSIGVALLAGSVMLAQVPGLQPIRVAVLYPNLPIMVGQAHGVFAKYGVDVRVNTVSNSNTLRGELGSSRVDLAHAAVDNAVAMVEAAGVDVVIVMGGESSANELIVQPGIRSISDLRGQTLIVDAPTTAYALQLKKILSVEGLSAAADYELKTVGPTPQRLAEMRKHKEYAGSILGPPTSIVAKRDGFVSLGSTNALIGQYQATGAFVPRTWASEHRDTLERYISAYVEVQRWLLAPGNKQSVQELIAKEWLLSAVESAEAYELMTKKGWYEPDARFDVDAFKTVLNLRAELEGQWHGRPPAADKYYDLSFYAQALAKLRP